MYTSSFFAGCIVDEKKTTTAQNSLKNDGAEVHYVLWMMSPDIHYAPWMMAQKFTPLRDT